MYMAGAIGAQYSISFAGHMSLQSVVYPFFITIGLVLATAASIRSPFTMGAWHSTHTGASWNVKLSLIHPLQSSDEQDHIEVNSSGASSTGFFRE